jgi:mono/diheme cytochrome c family protein
LHNFALTWRAVLVDFASGTSLTSHSEFRPWSEGPFTIERGLVQRGRISSRLLVSAKVAIALVPLIAVIAVAAGFTITYHVLGKDGAWAYLNGVFRPSRARPLTSVHFEYTPARLKRGEYLVAVARCFSCHSETDPKTDWPLPGVAGAGAIRQQMIRLAYPNITPDSETGSGFWTDDMLARAIREGWGHDGRPLIEIMPYTEFSHVWDEDVASIIVYLRSIPPVRHSLPKTKIPLPLNFVLRGSQRPLLRGPVSPPNVSDRIKTGEYLAHIGNCSNCHDGTDRDGHTLPYGGGQIISDHGEKVAAAANLTPDASGISYYDDALFVGAIRTGHVGARELAPAMPWRYFRNFTDEDLKSLFAYLRTLKPVRHRVDNTEPPTFCKLCGQTHGGGRLN